MFIKVAVEGQNPVIYRLSRGDILIGSSESCHVIIPHPSVSKKHVKLIRDDASWYAVDQGSTNGSYVDEDQLVPGKRYDITTESEIRLGDKIILILTDETTDALELNNPTSLEAPQKVQALPEQDKTRVISLEDLKKAKAAVVKNRQRENKKRLIQETKLKKKESTYLRNMILASAFIILAGYQGSKYWSQHKEKSLKNETVVKKVVTKYKGDDEVEKEIEGFRIRRSTLLPRNLMIDQFNKYVECIQEEVRELCSNGILSDKGNGAQFIAPMNYVLYVDETKILPVVYGTYLREPPIDKETARKLLFFSLLESELSPDKFPSQADVYVAFYYFDEVGNKRISTISAYKNSFSLELLKAFAGLKLTNPESDLEGRLKTLENFYTVY